MRKVKSIREIEKFDIYDITVENDHCFELYNGVVAHNSLFPKDIVSGGTGVYYSADNIYIIGRQQEKEGTDIVGYNFIINVEKSRYVREKSKIPVEVTYEGGISKWSGLLDVAVSGGFVTKPTVGWYSRKGEDKKYRAAETYNKDFWLPIISSKEFQQHIKDTYLMSSGSLMASDISSEDLASEYQEADDDV